MTNKILMMKSDFKCRPIIILTSANIINQTESRDNKERHWGNKLILCPPQYSSRLSIVLRAFKINKKVGQITYNVHITTVMRPTLSVNYMRLSVKKTNKLQHRINLHV